MVTVPQALLNTACSSRPFRFNPTLLKLKVVFVPLLIFDQLLPPFVLACHCTVGVGFPFAAATKAAVPPAQTVKLVGEPVTTGVVPMTSVNVTAFAVVGEAQAKLEVSWQSIVSP